MTATMPSNPELADHLIDKLRVFAETLEPTERELLAALLAPGIDAAWGAADDPLRDVEWHRSLLRDHLAGVIRRRHLRVEGW